ncbi:MAG: Fic family protein [Brevundimonas sp.]
MKRGACRQAAQLSISPAFGQAELHRDKWESSLQSSNTAAFAETLRSIASEVTGKDQAFRDGPVFTSPDAEGVRVVFPRPGTFPTRLTALHRHLAEDSAPPVFRGMIALVALTNCHPFWDGNGRTARIVANLILNALTDVRLGL